MTKNQPPSPRVSCAPPPSDPSVAPLCPQAGTMIISALTADQRAARLASAFQASADFDLEAF